MRSAQFKNSISANHNSSLMPIYQRKWGSYITGEADVSTTNCLQVIFIKTPGIYYFDKSRLIFPNFASPLTELQVKTPPTDKPPTTNPAQWIDGWSDRQTYRQTDTHMDPKLNEGGMLVGVLISGENSFPTHIYLSTRILYVIK